MATPTAKSPPTPTDPLEGFSASVRRVAGRLGGTTEVTPDRIVAELLGDHSDYGADPSFASRLPPVGEARGVDVWLARVRELFDPEALARSPSKVVDGRLTILALGRLAPVLGQILRTARLGTRLERGLGFRLASVLHPWALPPEPTEVVELQTFELGAPRTGCRFTPDARLLVTTALDGTVRVWDVLSGELRASAELGPGEASGLDVNGDGLLAIVGDDGGIRIWDARLQPPYVHLPGGSPLRRCAFSPDGLSLAVEAEEGFVVWDLPSRSRSWGLSDQRAVAFSPDGRLLASVDSNFAIRLADARTGEERGELLGSQGPPHTLAFSPDGRLLATTGYEDELQLWDVASRTLRDTYGTTVASLDCAFDPTGRLVATTGVGGTLRIRDALSGEVVAEVGDNAVRMSASCTFSPDGRLLAEASDTGTVRVWELVDAPGALPAVAPDLVGGVDLVGIGKDATALANVIAASGTQPPLSIGLFGDWGAGKTFLIGEVQRRVRAIARRSRGRESAYCSNVRNIVFNAWHYADANLWASIVSHIFDELAKPEPDSGADEREAQTRAAKLEEEIAAGSVLTERLLRAQEHARRVEARKSLARWIVGAPEGEKLENLRHVGPFLRLVAGNRWAVAVTALLAAGAVAGVVLGVGWSALGAAAVWLGVLGAWRLRLGSLLKQANEQAKVADIRTPDLDAQVEAAQLRTRELQEDQADLASGRRLPRFAAKRTTAGDYRSQLGLVSQIHRDFERMSELLTDPPPEIEGELPQIDRIVLYIDDLDRCEPHRVVEVLKAVHLILAVPLFVVVLAVDPRWLLSSLRLHYAELFGPDEEDEAWRSSPLHYLEKIIQVPFALRPMGGGVESLVHGLLPVAAPATGVDAVAAEENGAGAAGAQAPAQEPEAAAPAAPQAAPEPRPGLSPRTLALTSEERDFAVTVAAAAFETPRTVKKFTNLYRLLRAGLDDEELEELLATDTGEVAQYRAVMILLAVVIAFPEDASAFLLGLGKLDPDAERDERDIWVYLETYEGDLGAFLRKVRPDADTMKREPFRRWALEVSRYSFATGQEVFAGFRPGV